MKNRCFNIVGINLIPFTALSVVTLLYLFLPVTANLTNLLHTTSEKVSQLTTCFGFFYAFGFLIWGALSDKFGRKNIIIGGLLSLSLVTFLLTLYINYNYLLLLRCLQGFFASSFPPVILAWLAENLDEKYRKRAISFISCAFILAGTLGQWYGATMIQSSINISMYTLAIIYLLSGLVFYFITQKIVIHKPSQPIQSSHNVSLLKVFTQIPNVLLDKKLIRIYVCALFVLMSFVSLYVFLNSSNHIAININQLRQIATLAMLISLISSWIFSKITVTKVLACSLFTMSATLIIQLLFIYDYISMQYLFLAVHFVFVASIALAIPSMIMCSSIFSTQKNRGVAVSLYTCILFLGASLGSWLPGRISMNTLFILISSILFIVGFSVSKLKLDPPQKKREE